MDHPNTEGRAEADRATRRNGSAVLAAMLLAAPAIASAQTAPPAAPAQAAPAQAAPAPQAAPQAAAPAPAAAAPVQVAPAPAAAPAPPAAAQAPAAAAPAPAAAAQMRFSGSTTMGERMVPDLVDAYLAGAELHAKGWAPGETPNQRIQEARGADGQAVRITVTSTGGQLFNGLNERRADIAMASRPPSAEELTAFRAAYGLAADASPQEHVLALDGLAVIVNTENPVGKLKLDQIRDLYAGAITNWSALGGPNAPVRLYARQADATATVFFARTVMGRKPVAGTVERHATDTNLTNAVAAEIGAIGVVPFPFIGRNRALNLVASCGVEYEASEFGLKTEDYPLSRRLYLYPTPQPNELAQRFLRFTASAAAHGAVRDADYVSLQPLRGTAAHSAARVVDASRAASAAADARYAESLLEYNVATRGGQRLSATFRFTAGSAQLDARGRDDLERVAEFLKQPEQQAAKVNVFGFTDASGAFGVNRSVSNQRANEVAAQLRQRGVRIAATKGFGPVAPVACDDDPNTGVRNRRVEIWLAE